MPIDPSIPKDNDLISTFPAAIREARQVVADYASGDTPLEGITVEHPVGSSTFVTAEELACVSGVASNIQDQIDGKDPAGTAAGLVSTHASSSDHDGRYYTETEVNTLLSGKADVTQLHNAVTVTDTTSINLTLTGQALSADAIFGTTSGTVAQGSDSRFVTDGDSHDHTGGAGAQIAYSSLSGLPILHNPVTIADTSSIELTLDGQQIAAAAIFGVLAGTVCQGNDSRLSDARTPTAHTTGSHSDWPASVSMTEVGYLDGVSSSVQAQINGKEPAFTTLPISKGGTGSATQNFVDLTTDQTIGGYKSFTNTIATAGNLNFTGTGNRITGDFSNTTISNRVMFQTSTTNGATSMYSLPNGTSTAATHQVLNSSDPNNTARGLLGINAVFTYIASQVTGSGALLPLSLRMANTDHLLLSTNGNIVVKTGAAQANDDSSAKLQTFGGVLERGGAGIGYGAGSGGQVVQATSKSTAVTLNKPTGRITTTADALAAGSTVYIVLYNSLLGQYDTLNTCLLSGNGAKYDLRCVEIGAGACVITLKNISAGSLSEAVTFNFSIIKGAIA